MLLQASVCEVWSLEFRWCESAWPGVEIMTAGLSFRWRLGPEDHTDKNPPAPAVLVFARQIAELDGKNAEHDEKAIERAGRFHSWSSLVRRTISTIRQEGLAYSEETAQVAQRQ